MMQNRLKKNEHYLISVVIPIYNARPFLEQCLNSIEAQSYGNLEIICLNDGSTDGSLEIIKQHAVNDSRYRIIDKKNQGYGATCNRGLREARGDYISIIEPDDWIESGMYTDMLAFAEKIDGNIDLIKTAYWRILFPDTPQEKRMNCSFRNRIKLKHQPFTIVEAPQLLRHHPSIWSALYRRDFLLENRIQFKEYPGAGWADNPFLIETLCRAKKIVYLDEPYYCYREDTPEKFSQFVKDNALLPLERWIVMKNILDDLCITDESILRAHNSRGFTYLDGVLQNNELSKEGLEEQIYLMFSQMDPYLVFSDTEIPPHYKLLFAKTMDLPKPKLNNREYFSSLINQGFYDLRNLGVRNTFNRTKEFFSRNKTN